MRPRITDPKIFEKGAEGDLTNFETKSVFFNNLDIDMLKFLFEHATKLESVIFTGYDFNLDKDDNFAEATINAKLKSLKMSWV